MFTGSYEEYEEKAEEIRKKNEEYLIGFERRLTEKGLTEKTITNHVQNVEFYINSFLLRCEPLDVTHGCTKVSDFLGDYFIRKAMWSTAASIKQNITSFKKFYGYLLEVGVIKDSDYEHLCETILDEKDDWIDLVNRYNDPG